MEIPFNADLEFSSCSTDMLRTLLTKVCHHLSEAIHDIPYE